MCIANIGPQECKLKGYLFQRTPRQARKLVDSQLTFPLHTCIKTALYQVNIHAESYTRALDSPHFWTVFVET